MMISARKGLTLVEILVAIGISAVLVGVTAAVLKTGFDTYSFVQQEMLLQKALDETLDDASGEGFQGYGIKDGLEILDITAESIVFVPMWVEEQLVQSDEFFLSRKLRPGSTIPIAEILDISFGRRKGDWRQIPITFIPGQSNDPLKFDDRVISNVPLSPGGKIRFTFQPDPSRCPECTAFIGWEKDRIIYKYKGKSSVIPRFPVSGVVLSDFNLKYFDNTNTEVEPSKDNIPNVTGVQIGLSASKDKVSKRGFIFVNLRNTRTSGTGLLIHQGTKIKIAGSDKTRMFSITNISGIKEAGRIELEARPRKGAVWKAIIELGFDTDGRTPLVKRYSIEYPAGNRVFSQSVDLTADQPLNFMNLTSSSSFGSSAVKDAKKTVKVTGDVDLVVTRMDAKGAMLFIRP